MKIFRLKGFLLLFMLPILLVTIFFIFSILNSDGDVRGLREYPITLAPRRLNHKDNQVP